MRQKDLSSNKRQKKRRWFLGIIATIIIWFVFFDDYSLLTRYRLYNQKNQLHNEIKQFEKSTDSLIQKLETLEKNSMEIEKKAREMYGLRRKGEYVIKIINKKKQ